MRFARKLKAVRDLRRSAQGGGFTPPYLQDLYPIPNDEGVCVISNHGGRYNKFDDTTTAIDQIGDETRALEPDRCYTIPATKTGEIVLTTPINYTKYFISKWLGKVNTLIYADSTNKYTYIDGILTSTVAASNLTSIDLQEGDNYLIYLADLSTLSDANIESWMNTNACLFAVDNVNFSTLGVDYNRYLCNESTGTNSFDSGTATKNNGVTYSDSVITDINNVTIYNEKLKNRSNLEGWNKVAWFGGNGLISYNPIGYNNGSITFIFKCYKVSINTTTASLTIDSFSGIVLRNTYTFPRIYIGGAYKSFSNIIINDGDYHFFAVSYNRVTGEVICANESLSQSNTYSPVDLIGSINIGGIAINNYNITGTLGGFEVYYNALTVSQIEAIRDGISLLVPDISDPLNGSTTGTPINIDFNKIVIPNDAANIGFDIFGRESLYKGSAKYNILKDGLNLDFSNGGETAIGHLPFAFFNQLAFETNTFGFTPIYTYDIYAYINFANPFSMSPELFNLLCENPKYILKEYRGMWYSFKQSVLTDSVFYSNQRTLEQNNKIITKGSCPDYNI